MTIAKRLTVLLAVPLLALVGFGVFSRLQFTTIETRSQFVAVVSSPRPAAARAIVAASSGCLVRA